MPLSVTGCTLHDKVPVDNVICDICFEVRSKVTSLPLSKDSLTYNVTVSAMS